MSRSGSGLRKKVDPDRDKRGPGPETLILSKGTFMPLNINTKYCRLQKLQYRFRAKSVTNLKTSLKVSVPFSLCNRYKLSRGWTSINLTYSTLPFTKIRYYFRSVPMKIVGQALLLPVRELTGSQAAAS